jgi:large subunit ribosomal protein L27
VGCGKDYTLFAKAEGHVVFETKGPFNRQYVSIRPAALSAQRAA